MRIPHLLATPATGAVEGANEGVLSVLKNAAQDALDMTSKLFLPALSFSSLLTGLNADSKQPLLRAGSGQTGQSRAPGDSPPLVNFQVAQPLTFPSSWKSCTVELIHHNFAASYYKPAIAEWTPPTDCGEPSEWGGVSMNYTATSNGTQYDRLSAVTFHNVEIWRTSTPEPTYNGIIWTHLKDATKYLPLFVKPGRLILDLNNIVDEKLGLNGEYDVTFSVTVYQRNTHDFPVQKADVIIPLSNLSPDQANYASVPPSLSTKVKLPKNAVEAYAEIYASGNWYEEFWYYHVANEWISALPEGAARGQGPFREVQLLVDGMLAGFATPFPVLFTGAYAPLVWRPVSAYGSLDQPTYHIDLTPFIPLLADGKEHTVTIDVVSAERTHSILENWWVSGNIQVSTSGSDKQTTGHITRYVVPEYALATISGSTSPSEPPYRDVNVTVTADHRLYIEAEIQNGWHKKTVRWSQSHSFSNKQEYRNHAGVQNMTQVTAGSSISTHNGIPKISDKFHYPLSIDFYHIKDTRGDGYGVTFDLAFHRTELHPLHRTLSTVINSHRKS
ncbi:hypothetical protein FRC03_006028, partial [Tulasnella sp. 419]